MALTGDVLQAHLQNLDAAVHELPTSEGDHFLVGFTGMADASADAAGADDRCWIEDRVLALLERRGLASLAKGEV